MSLSHLIILAIVLLIFGPRRLPELGRTFGKGLRNFKDALDGVRDAAYRHVDEESPPPPVETASSPSDPSKPESTLEK